MPHERKALTMGGIPWQWAIEYLKLEDTLEGPSCDCLNMRPVCTVNGVTYYDNNILDSELDILVGSYYVETSELNFTVICIFILYLSVGIKGQIQILSILPMISDHNSYPIGEDNWTERDEEWSQRKISEGLKLKTRSSWKSAIRTCSLRRKALENLKPAMEACFYVQ